MPPLEQNLDIDFVLVTSLGGVPGGSTRKSGSWTESKRMSLISDALNSGKYARKSAATPATTGDAMLVPL